MVSAVFHTSLDTQARPQAAPVVAPAKPRPIVAAVVPPERVKPGFDWRGLAMKVLPPIVGIAVLIGIWAIATLNSTTFPTPGATFAEAVKVFADPFYRNGPNDQGIGWNILFSLERVAVGFGLAALVGIPAEIGRAHV